MEPTATLHSIVSYTFFHKTLLSWMVQHFGISPSILASNCLTIDNEMIGHLVLCNWCKSDCSDCTRCVHNTHTHSALLWNYKASAATLTRYPWLVVEQWTKCSWSDIIDTVNCIWVCSLGGHVYYYIIWSCCAWWCNCVFSSWHWHCLHFII